MFTRKIGAFGFQKNMVGRVGLFRASSATSPALLYLLRPCSRALHPLGHLRFAVMFKFAPGEFVESSTIGLKVRNGVNKQLIIQLLTGTPVATYAQLCTSVHN